MRVEWAQDRSLHALLGISHDVVREDEVDHVQKRPGVRKSSEIDLVMRVVVANRVQEG
jgi:hypothetical protein